MRERLAPRWRLALRLLVAAAGAVALIACSGPTDQSGAAEAVAETLGDGPVELELAAEADETAPGAPSALGAAGWTTATSHVFGGFSFEHPSDHLLGQTRRDSIISLFPPDGPRGFVLITRLSESFDGAAITTSQELISVAEREGGAGVALTDSTIEMFGRELVGYQFQGVTAGPLFSGHPPGFPRDAWWSPGDRADLYLADLDDSVLVLMASGTNEDDIASMTELLRSIAASAELTTDDGLIAPLPTPDQRVELDLGAAPTITAAAPADTGAPTAVGPSIQTDAGPHQFVEFGFPIEFTLTNDMAIPRNDSSLLAIGGDENTGPYQHDLRAHIAIAGLVAMGAGDVPIGELIPIDDLMTGAPPANLAISQIDTDASIGDATGWHFSVEIVDSAECGGVESPCNYAFVGPFEDFSLVLGEGHVHEVWIVPDVPNGPLVLIASAPASGARWITEAQSLIDTMSIFT